MNFLDENGLARLWTHILSKFERIIKKEDIATEVTETEENPVSGAAVAAYIAENSNNDAAGKNVAEQTFNTFWDKEAETFNTAVANEGAEIFNDYRERNVEIYQDDEYDLYEVDYQGNVAIGVYSHAEGIGNTAMGTGSHAEGYNTIAGGERVIWEDEPPIITEYDHAEGYMTQAIGGMSHAEGSETIAYGGYSHAEGKSTQASGGYSHAEGHGTIAEGQSQHVQGEYNIADNVEYIHIVGNGSVNRRSNAHTLDYDGNAWFKGDVYTGSTSGTNKDEGSKKLSTLQNLVDGEGSGALKSINSTSANGNKAVALGNESKSEGGGSFSANYRTEAFGHNSAAFGYQNKTARDYEFVLGQYNDYQLEYVENVTNTSGTSNASNGIYKLSSEPTIIDEGYRIYYQINGDYTESTIADLQNGDIYIYDYQNVTRFTSYEICTSDPTDGSYEGYEYKAYSFTSHKIQITNNRILTVGNGTDEENRSNAMTLDWDGNVWFSGNLSLDQYKLILLGEYNYISGGADTPYLDLTSQHDSYVRGLRINSPASNSSDASGLEYIIHKDSNTSFYKVYTEQNIIYSATEPENPTVGTLWLQP